MHRSIGVMQINVPGSDERKLIHTTHNLFRAQQNRQDRNDLVQPLSNPSKPLKSTDITEPAELLPQGVVPAAFYSFNPPPFGGGDFFD